MKAVNTLRIANKNVFYGPGPQLLLFQIGQHASLRSACAQTGISYTKALRMLKKIEEEVGFPVVQSERGGSERGGTQLTEKGKQLVKMYAEAQEQVDTFAQELVEEKFTFLKENE